MATTRGNVDTIDQTQARLLSGGSAATMLLTTDGSALTTGHLLKTDADGNVIDSGVAASGIGSVTSVGMTVPSRQTVSGSPVTGAGTLAITDNSQSANRVFAGPTSGGSAAPAFRALVTADLPAGSGSVTSVGLIMPADFTVSGSPITTSGSITVTGGHGVLGVVIDGGGSAPSTGSKGFVQCPYGATITGWTLLADVSGSAQITVKKSTYSGFPTTSSIVASAPPSMSSAQKATSTTLTGWTTAITLGDVLEFNLDSVTTCTRVILELQVTKS